MLIGMSAASRTQPRAVVFAYDVASPRRARRVRAVLQSRQTGAQYSVFELRLMRGEAIGLLTELQSQCDAQEDRLALWWPHEGARFGIGRERDARHDKSGVHPMRARHLAAGTGNYVVCYDISEPARLRKVNAAVSSCSLALQRSVYWLRASNSELARVLDACRPHVAATDRLWVYPLRQASNLWRVGAVDSAVLPMGDHHWPCA